MKLEKGRGGKNVEADVTQNKIDVYVVHMSIIIIS